MNPHNKFWWFFGIAVGIIVLIVLAGTIIFWKGLLPYDAYVMLRLLEKNFAYIFIASVLFLGIFGMALDAIFNNYIIPINKLAEETALIHTANPSHRIKVSGSKDILNLRESINQLAQRHEDIQKNIQDRIAKARAEADGERNTMAAFMAELPEGVLICNANGQILMYNNCAKRFLADEPGGSETDSGLYIGIGRSIYGVIDKNLIVHAVEDIAAKLERDESNVASYFVLMGKDDRVLRVEAVPILNRQRAFSGFVLILFDITRQIESVRRVDYLLQSLLREGRASLAGVRSAVEAILEYPEMSGGQMLKFNHIIHKESLALGELLNRTAVDYSSHVKSQWPLVPMPDQDLAEIVSAKAKEKLGVEVTIGEAREKNWISVDRYSIVLAILFVLDRLRSETGIIRFACLIKKEDSYVNFDLTWQGEPLKIETLRRWENRTLMIGNELIPLTLKEVVGHHVAEIWSFSSRESDLSCFRLMLPATEEPELGHIRNIAILPESRSEYFDFDLFSQPGQVPGIDNRPLTELTYTVFDTETTGLDPRTDEIISIGAVRIVNGHLLREEVFDRLIDPGRSLPRESTKIHGITPEMLKGQPVIGKVLPLFHKFAEDTVLVAHNAAFDMKMLAVNEKRTGTKFINPVLDTLLLSAVVHPNHLRHSMEALSERLGVTVLGRHTALGDAMATAEMFLKIIPLLREMGITTLKDARLMSKKTYYARLKY